MRMNGTEEAEASGALDLGIKYTGVVAGGLEHSSHLPLSLAHPTKCNMSLLTRMGLSLLCPTLTSEMDLCSNQDSSD